MSQPSKHLSFEENQMVFNMLGERRESLSTAVIQLLFSTTTRPFQWQIKVTGVVCFVKDPIRKGFFIEVSYNAQYFVSRSFKNFIKNIV